MNFQYDRSTQSVEASSVSGDVYQMKDINGNVVILAGGNTSFVLENFNTEPVPIEGSAARAQPSRLLIPRYQVVPFEGRESDLDALSKWLTSEEPFSINLLHGPGGQGKTRFATHFANQHKLAGWTALRAQAAITATAGNPITVDGEASVLVVVDYADRWTLSSLRQLATHLRSLTLNTSARIRLLLLGRTHGYWWTSFQYYCEETLFSSVQHYKLTQLAQDIGRRDILRNATKAFSTQLEADCDDALARLVDIEIDHEAFANALTLHMAALVAANAAISDDAAMPGDPSAISMQLLRRETVHWQLLHSRNEDRLQTSPPVMARTVYVAAAAGINDRARARKAIMDVDLAATPPDADKILDDHAFCYPPTAEGGILEPLQPDRLAEDFIALSTPGHNRTSWQPDDWTISAVRSLVAANCADSDDVTPVLNSTAVHALTVLVETALRWRHVAVGIVLPLLREHPRIAIGAGGNVLAKILELHPDHELLERIDAYIPFGVHSDMSDSAAKIAEILAARRLAAASGPVEKIAIYVNMSSRLAKVDDFEGALAATTAAVEISRLLNSDVEENLRYRAKALLAHGFSQFQAGRYLDAYKSFSEGRKLVYPMLADQGGTITEMAELAKLFSGESMSLSELGSHDHAAVAANNAVRIHRQIEQDTPGCNLFDLAGSLSNLSKCIRRDGRPQDALDSIIEAVAIYRQLSQSGGLNEDRNLAVALTEYVALLTDLQENEQALLHVQSAIEVLADIAEHNPTMTADPMANALSCAAVANARLGRHRVASDLSSQATEILRPLLSQRPGGVGVELARELTNHSASLMQLGEYEKAIAASLESVQIYHWLREHQLGFDPRNMAAAYFNLGSAHGELQQFADAFNAYHDGWRVLEAVAADPTVEDNRNLGYVGGLLARLAVQNRLSVNEELITISESSRNAYLMLLETFPDEDRYMRHLNTLDADLETLRERFSQ